MAKASGNTRTNARQQAVTERGFSRRLERNILSLENSIRRNKEKNFLKVATGLAYSTCQTRGNARTLKITYMTDTKRNDPHMNAETKTELFGEMFTRRCNIVANGICETGIVQSGIPASVAAATDFEPIFKPYLPKNEVEQLQMIQTAVGGQATTSRRRGIELNPLNDDPDRVEEEIAKEQQEALALASASMGIGDTSNEGVTEEE